MLIMERIVNSWSVVGNGARSEASWQVLLSLTRPPSHSPAPSKPRTISRSRAFSYIVELICGSAANDARSRSWLKTPREWGLAAGMIVE